MKPRKVHRTSRIKPETRNAILDQLAAIANGIIRREQLLQGYKWGDRHLRGIIDLYGSRRWWHRFAWWRK